MANGKDCKCYAYCESECACGADWTPQEVYDLRASNARLLGLIADIRAAVGDPTGKLMQDELLAHCRSLRLTEDEREAIEVAVEYVGSAYAVQHHAAMLRGLLERMK